MTWADRVGLIDRAMADRLLREAEADAIGASAALGRAKEARELLYVRRAVRECLGVNCGWLFLDRSRGGRRRWCSDETCGTRSRVERFRARTGTNA